MKLPSLICLLVSALCWNASAGESVKKRAPSLAGHFYYERGGNYACTVSIQIRREKGKHYSLALQAGRVDAKGAAPDGEGEGEVNAKGVFHFTFEDSFSNKGTGSFQWVRPGRYRLQIDITDVQDSRCMMYYGDEIMRRVPKG